MGGPFYAHPAQPGHRRHRADDASIRHHPEFLDPAASPGRLRGRRWRPGVRQSSSDRRLRGCGGHCSTRPPGSQQGSPLRPCDDRAAARAPGIPDRVRSSSSPLGIRAGLNTLDRPGEACPLIGREGRDLASESVDRVRSSSPLRYALCYRGIGRIGRFRRKHGVFVRPTRSTHNRLVVGSNPTGAIVWRGEGRSRFGRERLNRARICRARGRGRRRRG